MSSKMPPVPPESRNEKGPDPAQTKLEEVATNPVKKPDQQGQQGNIKQNTPHQGHQQNR